MQCLVLHTVIHGHSGVGDVGLVALVRVDADSIDIGAVLYGRLNHCSALSGEGGDAWCAVALYVWEDNSD